MNLDRRQLLQLVVCAAALLPVVSYAALPAHSDPKPNFIILFTDDQGYQDLGVFGSPTIKTPHIDQMAEEGRIFSSFYVASPLCSASRAALLTGCYPKRIGMEKPVFFPQDRVGIHRDEVTIADMLKTADYATACIGKWHLGHRKPFLPTSQGFDYYFGIPYSNDMSHPDNKNKPWGKWDECWKSPEQMVKRWNTPLMENEEIIELPVDQRTITRRYTDKAIEFITANKDKPFFLYLPHSMPHVPLFVPEDAYDPDPKNAYKAVIEHIDAEVGRVIDTVKVLGLSNKTYIIFTSDNGPWLGKNIGHHGGSAKPLSGGKGWFQEGGIRVPCVMWGPGRIPANTRTDEMASTLDLFPTIAKLANVQPKTRGPIDGVDVSGLMMGKEPSPRTELLYYSGTKLVGMRKGDWKILGRDLEQKPALYNLAEDLGERHNLAQEQPEKLAELKARMKGLDAQISKEIRPLGIYSLE
ncbi:MAG: sulfatase [Planctomycetota bacterium]|nr:sulfatase [Planctomycetota bacterium]